jgi:LmbE family N-acetylglucosaminyl deacetylase
MARDRSIFPEHLEQGLDTHITDELWFTSFDDSPNHIVDISTTFEKKLSALEAHKSQLDDLEALRKDVTNHAKAFSKGNNYEYAEGFIRLLFD